jgi:tyrosine-protein kinase Etk/Wzc
MMSNNRELKVNMMDVLETLVRRKWGIIGFTFVVTVAAIVASLVMKPVYMAETVLMPPSSSETSGIKGILKNTPLGKIGGLEKIAGSVPNDLASIYLAILASRTLQLDVIEKFNLVHVYKMDKAKSYFVEDLLKLFRKHVGFGLEEGGTLTLSVIDENPARAAAIANYMAQKLDERYKELMTEKNRNYRVFLGERLALAKVDLERAEKNLVDFQKANRMMDIESQARATVTAGVNLEARYLAVKGNLEVASKTYSPDHPKVRELQLQMEQLDKQRRALSRDKVSDFLLPYQAGPDLALEFVRLSREQEIQQAVFELMVQQYEEARFEESRNTPNVQILDVAEPPQKRISPKRRRMVQFAFIFGIVAGSLGTLLLEYAGRFGRNNPEEAARMKRLLRQAWAIRTPR